MSQGDFILVSNKNDIDFKIKHISERIKDWDYCKPLSIKFEVYKNVRSLPQSALAQMWYREIAKAMKKKGHDVDHKNPEEVWKLWLKKRFLGVEEYTIGKEIISGQVKRTSKLNSGEMSFFMDQVYHWATDLGVILTIPKESEYAINKAKQNA